MAEQWIWYAQLEPQLLGRFLRWLVSQHLVQSMLGVPKSQQHLAKAYFQDGMVGYVRHCGRISTYTTSLSGFLKQHPGQYTHFVLLDHQDWLAACLRPALDEEWRLILDNAAPGAQVLLRSAAVELDFLPDFARERLTFNREAAAWSQANNRVGTYASTWLATIKQ